jgi:hypothetical protein
VDFPRRMAVVRSTLSDDQLCLAVPTAGAKFKATVIQPETVTFRVPKMRCMKNCGSKVSRALSDVPGVTGETY